MVGFGDDYNLKPGQLVFTVFLWKTGDEYYVTFFDDFLTTRIGKNIPKFGTGDQALEWARDVCNDYVVTENAAGRKAQRPAELDNGDVGPVVKIVDISVIDKLRQKRRKPMPEPSLRSITVDPLNGLELMGSFQPLTDNEKERLEKLCKELKALLETDLPKLLTAEDFPLDKDDENNAPLFLDPDLEIFHPECKSIPAEFLLSFPKKRMK